MLRNWSGVGGDDNIPCTCTHFECYATGLGWGGDDNVPCTCTHVECYATGLGWGGMITFLALVHMLNATQLVRGGGGDDNVPCTCTHVECYATGLGWGGDDNVPCTCTHVECYATGLGWGGMITFLALVHMLNRLWQDLRSLRTHCFFKKHSERSESSLENICLCLHVRAKCGQCMA